MSCEIHGGLIDLMKKLILELIKIISSISPKFSTHILYLIYFNKRLDLNNPKTLNEKILWLKLNEYRNNKLITECADKYLVREYVKKKGLENILNDLLFVYDTYKTINFDLLPNSFAIKCNHGAGYNILCRDKKKLDRKAFIKQLKKWYKTDFWKKYAEINYKNIEKKIVVEKLLVDKENNLPSDYKFYCFNGEPKTVMVCTDRETTRPKFFYFNEKWELLMLSKDAKNNPNVIIEKPRNLNLMFEYARILSRDFKFVRVDLYYLNHAIYFGELTFTPSGGLDNSRLTETDLIFGQYLDLTVNM